MVHLILTLKHTMDDMFNKVFIAKMQLNHVIKG